LYSSIFGYFIYAALGTCKVINFGPTILVSMLVRPYTEEFGPEAVILITFLTGVITAVLALSQLGS
jgi:solute carrier family 26 (sodium-independent sulfate anion transporter), member 11